MDKFTFNDKKTQTNIPETISKIKEMVVNYMDMQANDNIFTGRLQFQLYGVLYDANLIYRQVLEPTVYRENDNTFGILVSKYFNIIETLCKEEPYDQKFILKVTVENINKVFNF